MHPKEPNPVKLILGVLFTDAALSLQAKDLLTSRYGQIDYESPLFDFDISDYYYGEMGRPIFRQFYSFEPLIQPQTIARIKIETTQIEDMLAVANKRKVNLDPGYMDYDKFVLASAKYNGQKVYLDLGIWADLTLHYEKGHFDPFPWSFPDFKRDTYHAAFLRMREIYKHQLKRAEPD